ncbi:MAG: hypothetical protein AMXMBFR58_35420 [Phycisphaerae bacterium]|nr:hypothetical protein [Phycisphaerales bacterium]
MDRNKRASVLGIVAWCALASAAHGGITLTSGYMSLAASWTGGDPVLPDPDVVYSGSKTVTWTAGEGYAFVDLPLITAGGNDIFPGEDKIVAKSGIGGGFNDVRVHAFTFTAIHTIRFEVTEDMTFWRGLYPAGELLGPFDVATLQNLDTGAAPIDLLTNETGFAPAGSYELQLLVTQEWESDTPNPSFHMDLFIAFSAVPAPGTAGLLGVSAVAAVRRRRRS